MSISISPNYCDVCRMPAKAYYHNIPVTWNGIQIHVNFYLCPVHYNMANAYRVHKLAEVREDDEKPET